MHLCGAQDLLVVSRGGDALGVVRARVPHGHSHSWLQPHDTLVPHWAFLNTKRVIIVRNNFCYPVWLQLPHFSNHTVFNGLLLLPAPTQRGWGFPKMVSCFLKKFPQDPVKGPHDLLRESCSCYAGISLPQCLNSPLPPHSVLCLLPYRADFALGKFLRAS